jgi:chemotaxis protein methyltransferase WspC
LKLADAGRYDEASSRVERVIAESGASSRAYFLLGMIRQAAGDRDRAEAYFLKAVYLDGQDDEALLALALLAHRRGDVATESVYRRRAERVRSRKGAR